MVKRRLSGKERGVLRTRRNGQGYMLAITFFKHVSQLVIYINCKKKSFAAQNIGGACAPVHPLIPSLILAFNVLVVPRQLWVKTTPLIWKISEALAKMKEKQVYCLH